MGDVTYRTFLFQEISQMKKFQKEMRVIYDRWRGCRCFTDRQRPRRPVISRDDAVRVWQSKRRSYNSLELCSYIQKEFERGFGGIDNI